MSHEHIGLSMTKPEIEAYESEFDSQECSDFVKNRVVDLDHEVAIGVCKKYLDNGYDSLSENQKNVFKITLQQNLLKCGRCEQFLWEEAEYIVENGLCTYCQKMWDND